MRRRPPDDGLAMPLSHRVYYGLAGAFLGGLIVLSLAFFLGNESMLWPAVGVFAVGGFALGFAIGPQAIDFLKWVWWWT